MNSRRIRHINADCRVGVQRLGAGGELQRDAVALENHEFRIAIRNGCADAKAELTDIEISRRRDLSGGKSGDERSERGQTQQESPKVSAIPVHDFIVVVSRPHSIRAGGRESKNNTVLQTAVSPQTMFAESAATLWHQPRSHPARPTSRDRSSRRRLPSRRPGIPLIRASRRCSPARRTGRRG